MQNLLTYCRENIFSTNKILTRGSELKKKLFVEKGKLSRFMKTDKTYRFIKRIISEQNVLLD